MKKNRTTLKDRFKKGLIPTEADFVDLIDSMLNQEEDNISKIASDPLKITALGADEALLNFYRIENNESKLSWQLKQKPGGKIGLEISDTTAGRLFIESVTGNVGIGNSSPKARLDIMQEARTGNHPAAVKGLYVTGNFSNDTDGVEFRHSSGAQGIGFGQTTIYAAGSSPDQMLGLKPRGSGKVVVFGGLQVNSSLQVTGASQLSGGLQVTGTSQLTGALQVTGAISTNGNLHAARSRLAFSDTPADANHTIYNNNSNIDGEGGWDGMKMNVFAGLDIRVGNASGVRPTSALKIDNAGNIGIGTAATAAAKLEVNGIVAFNDTSGWAVKNGFMASGSLTIGGTTKNYGGASGWTNSTAGLLLETLDNTEIAVHDSGQRLTSLMFYEGGASSNRITIGRDMGGGWGTISNLILNGNVGVGAKTPSARLSVLGPGANELGGSVRSTSLLVSAGTLGNTAGNELSLASIGCVTGNNNSFLGVRAYRAANGSDWGTTALGLGMDVDNTVRAGATLWLHANTNVGIGTASPVARLQVAGGAIMPAAGDSDAAGILFPLDAGGGGGDKAWMRYLSRTGEAMTLEIGIANDADDHIALMPSGNVGIGTRAPSAKLEVVGDFIRKIAMKTGLGPNDETDNGRIASRTLSFTKRYADTAIRIIYCDNLRVNGDNSAARWEIRIDGATVPGGALIADKYGNNGNRHDPTTVFGYATGVSAGAHEIQIWVSTIPGWNNDAFTGWNNSRWTIEAQEVWL